MISVHLLLHNLAVCVLNKCMNNIDISDPFPCMEITLKHNHLQYILVIYKTNLNS